MMKPLFVIGISIILVYISYRTYRLSTLDKGLAAKLKNGATILDVRTQAEYNTGHIEGSVNISLGEIRKRYIELDTSTTYITCCSHGLRSVKVETILKEKGFRHVYNGGAWPDLEKILDDQKELK